jgi:hypothetical protein
MEIYKAAIKSIYYDGVVKAVFPPELVSREFGNLEIIIQLRSLEYNIVNYFIKI